MIFASAGRSACLLFVLIISCFVTAPAWAQSSYLEVGNGSADWGNANAWSNGIVNGAGASAGIRLAPDAIGTVSLLPTVTLEELIVSGRGSVATSTRGQLLLERDGAGELAIRLRPEDGALTFTFSPLLKWAVGETLHADVPLQASFVLNGSLGASGNLLKTGGGTMRIGSANASWAGHLDVAGGTLIAGHAQSLGTTAGKTTIRGGGRLVLEHSTAESLVFNDGTLQLANKDLTGAIELSGAATIHRVRNPLLTDPRQFEFEQTLGATNVNSVISGGGSLTVHNQSIDQVWLRGNNTYTGRTYISAGTVNAATETALGSAAEGTTVNGGNLVVHAATSEQFRVEAGNLRFNSASVIPTAAIEVAGGDVHLNSGGASVATPIIVDGGNGGINGYSMATSFVGGSSGVGNLRVSRFSVDAPLAHQGDLTISNVKLNVANSYTGKTFVAGESELNHAGALGQSRDVQVTGGSLDVNVLPDSAVRFAVEGGSLIFTDSSRVVMNPITLGGPQEASLSSAGEFGGQITVVPGRRNRIGGGVYTGSISGTGAVEIGGATPTHLNAANSLNGAVKAGGNVHVNHVDALKASHTSVSSGTLHFNVPVNGHVLTNQDYNSSGTVAFNVAQDIEAPWVLNAGTLAVNEPTAMDRLITIGAGYDPTFVTGGGPLRIDGELTNLHYARVEAPLAGAGTVRNIGYQMSVSGDLAQFSGDLIAERGELIVSQTAANSLANGAFRVRSEGTLKFDTSNDTDFVINADVFLENAQGNGTTYNEALIHDYYASTARFLGRFDVGDSGSVTRGNFSIEGELVGRNLTHRSGALEIGTPQSGLTGTLRMQDGAMMLTGNGSLHGLETIQLDRGELWLRSDPSATQDRLGDDVTIASRGSRIHLYRHITPISAETIGVLHVQQGKTEVLASRETPLTVLNLQRERGAILALSLYSGERGVKLPNASLQFNGMLGAWAVTDTGFATLGSGGEFLTLAATKTSLAGAMANDHVKIAGPQTLAGDLTVASLSSVNPDFAVDLGGGRLQIASGGLFQVGKISNGVLTAGVDANPAELVVHHGREIAASIQDNAAGGAVSLVAHEGYTQVSGVNTYTGGTWIVSSEDQTWAYAEGQLSVLNFSAIPQNDRVHVDGGVYNLQPLPAGTAHVAELHVRGGGRVRSGFAEVDADKWFLEAGQISATLVGDGEMVKRTDGVLDFANSASPNYTGKVSVEAGRMLLQPTTLPKADFELKGGVVDFSGNGAIANRFTLDGGAIRGGRITGTVDVVGDSLLMHDGTTQIVGVLRGAGDLTVRGAQDNRFSEYVLLGGNGSQYSGNIDVASGALRISAPGAAGSGDVAVQSAGRLILGNTNYSQPALEVDNDVHLYGGTLISFFAFNNFGTPEASPSVLKGDLTIHGEGFVGSVSTGVKNDVRSPGLTLAGKVTLENGTQVFGLSDGLHSLADSEAASVDVAGELSVGENTTWNLLSSSVSISGAIRSTGAEGAIDFVAIPGQLRWNGAELIADEGKTLKVTVNGGDDLLRLNGVGNELAGKGTLRGNFAVAGGASVAPGASAGTLAIDGDLSFADDGRFKVELAAGQHDKLIVAGDATLGGGLLDISFLDGFVPQKNAEFTILEAASLTGMFSNSESLLSIVNGWRVDWDLSQVGTDLVLKATGSAQQGDFDGNGVVDGADLAVWRNGFGANGDATHGQGDADGNGVVDGADLMIWQRQASGLASPPASAGVPEPASAALLGMAALAAVLRRRSQRPVQMA